MAHMWALILVCHFPFSLVTNLFFSPANRDATESSELIYDDNIFFRKHDGVKKKISFKTILLRNVSFHVLGKSTWQLNYSP